MALNGAMAATLRYYAKCDKLVEDASCMQRKCCRKNLPGICAVLFACLRLRNTLTNLVSYLMKTDEREKWRRIVASPDDPCWARKEERKKVIHWTSHNTGNQSVNRISELGNGAVFHQQWVVGAGVVWSAKRKWELRSEQERIGGGGAGREAIAPNGGMATNMYRIFIMLHRYSDDLWWFTACTVLLKTGDD